MMDDDEPLLPGDAFTLAPIGENEPMEIAGRLVDACEEFTHLRHGEAVILFLMRADPKIKAQKAILGEMSLPRFQGGLAPLATWMLAKVFGEIPDFIMTLDQGWWTQAEPKAREALVFHELLHTAHALDKDGEPKFTPEGDPLWAMRDHDIAEFNDVVRRYGAWLPDIEGFIHALREGGAI